jgi:ribosome-associated toxin RatA of RatAB toxin-antitoxin module
MYTPVRVRRLFLLPGLAFSVFSVLSCHGANDPEPANDLFGLEPSGIRELVEGATRIEIVEQNGENYVRGLVFVPSDPATIWAVMKNCRATIEMVPQIRNCTLLEDSPIAALVEHRVKLVSLFPSLNYRFRVHFVDGNRVVFEYIGGDLKDLKGEWNIRPAPESGGSIVSLTMRMVPGGLIPSGMVNSTLRKRLPGVLEAFAKQVAAHGATRT